MKNETLIIGNKPNRNFTRMNDIVDSFKNNIRIGFGVAGDNNDGSILDELELCNHEYDNFIKNDYDLEKILSIYGNRYDKQYLTENYLKFKQALPKFNKVYHQPWDVDGNNSYLKSVGCPYSVIGLPRSGFSIMMDKILEGKRVFLVNFSLPQHYDEDFGFTEDRLMEKKALKREQRAYKANVKSFENNEKDWTWWQHHTANEVKIVRWLHENEIIDASLCLISDSVELTYHLDGMKVSSSIKNKLEK